MPANRLHWLILCLALIILGIVTPQPSHSQSDQALEIVFIVDQSGSMGGADYGQRDREPTDPLGLRFLSLEYAVEWLSNYREFLQSADTDLPIRFAIIAFGDAAFVTTDWIELAPAGALDWDEQFNALRATLTGDAFIAQFPPGNLGNTNFLAAFREAETLFNRAPAAPNTQRVAVIITDGQPCVLDGPEAFTCGSPSNEQQHMNQVFRLTQSAFPAPDYQLYVIALDETGVLWEARQSDWERIVGSPDRAAQVATPAELATQVQTILIDLVSGFETVTSLTPLNAQAFRPDALPIGSTAITLPPLQRQLIFTFFKGDTQPTTHLTLYPPDGAAPITSGSANVQIENAATPIEVWRIDYPAPGVWRVDNNPTAQTITNAYWQTQPMILTVNSTAGEPVFLDEIGLTVNIAQSDGSPLPIYPTPYSISASGQVTLPDGVQRPLSFSGSSDTFSTTTLIDVIGVYQVDLRLTIPNTDGTPVVIYEEAGALQFSVADVVLSADPLPSSVDYLEGSEFVTTVTLSSENNTPTQLNDISITGILELPNSQVSVPAVLQADGSYRLAITLTVGQPATLRIIAQARAADGRIVQVGNLQSSPFRVIASEPIRVQIIGEAVRQEYATGGFPQFGQLPLEIQLEAINQTSQQPVELAALAQDPNTPLQISLWRDGEPIDERAALFDAGRYSANFEALPVGSYEVRIAADMDLRQPYFILSPTDLTVMVEWTHHPHRQLVIVTVIGASLATLAAACIRIWIFYRQRQHPLRGTIRILRQADFDDPVEIWQAKLDGFKRNVYKISPKQMRYRTATDNLKQVVLMCPSATMHAQRQVQVIVQTTDKRRQQQTLMPGMSMSVNEDVFNPDAPKPVYQIELLAEEQSASLGGEYFDAF